MSDDRLSYSAPLSTRAAVSGRDSKLYDAMAFTLLLLVSSPALAWESPPTEANSNNTERFSSIKAAVGLGAAIYEKRTNLPICKRIRTALLAPGDAHITAVEPELMATDGERANVPELERCKAHLLAQNGALEWDGIGRFWNGAGDIRIYKTLDLRSSHVWWISWSANREKNLYSELFAIDIATCELVDTRAVNSPDTTTVRGKTVDYPGSTYSVARFAGKPFLIGTNAYENGYQSIDIQALSGERHPLRNACLFSNVAPNN